VGPGPITKPELEVQVESRVGAWAVARNAGWIGTYANWPMALGLASALGRVCHGPGLGGRVTYVRLADWSGWREEDPVEAGIFVLPRFLRTYGPSATAEFVRRFATEPASTRR